MNGYVYHFVKNRPVSGRPHHQGGHSRGLSYTSGDFQDAIEYDLPHIDSMVCLRLSRQIESYLLKCQFNFASEERERLCSHSWREEDFILEFLILLVLIQVTNVVFILSISNTLCM